MTKEFNFNFFGDLLKCYVCSFRCYLNWFKERDFDHGDVVAGEIDTHDVGRGRVRTRSIHSQSAQRIVTQVDALKMTF